MPKRRSSSRPHPGPIVAIRQAFAWLIVCLGIAGAAHAGDDAPSGPLDLRVASLEDPSGELSVDDVLELDSRFAAAEGGSAGDRFTASAYWFALRLERPEHDDRWLLELAYPLLDRIDLYLSYDDGDVEHMRSGDSFPFEQRPTEHRYFVFPVRFDEHQNAVDVRLRVVTKSSMQVPIRVWTQDAFRAHERDEQLVLGLYYGLLLAILLYNAVLALTVREAVYAYYSLYVLSYGVFQMCINGLAFEYLWPSSVYLAEKGTLIFMATSLTLAVVFSRDVLEIAPGSRLHTLFKWQAFCGAAALPLCFLLPYAVAIQLQMASIVLGTALLTVGGTLRYRDGVAAARFYLVAWSSFLAGIIVYVLKTYALLPENALTEYAIQVGSALEVVLLSFAIAHRYKAMREEKLRVRRESTALLEERVAERTATLERTLAELSTANRRLETLSVTDALSGVHNRSYFNTRFEQMWRAAGRASDSIAVLMIDIDRFKDINDSHGHLVGDEVIAAVGGAIADAVLRPGDLVARYGGEEFVAVLPSTTAAEALEVAERARVAIADRASAAIAGPKRVTASVGVAAEVPDTGDPSARSDALLAAADTALYRAKNEGRNGVRTAGSESPRTGASVRGERDDAANDVAIRLSAGFRRTG